MDGITKASSQQANGIMKTISSFINLGWHTVPLRGELKRREDGSKTEPKFEKNWKDKYAQEVNSVASKLGGTLTGACSGIMAIDCDNNITYQLIRSLDPEYEFEFKSKGKLDTDGNEKNCGTIIYEYEEDFLDTFAIHDGAIDLDFYSNNGFVYLPTEANETKEAWSGRVPKLKPMPESVRVLLKQLHQAHTTKNTLVTAEINDNIMTASCLAPLVREFVTTRKFMPGLFKILTPKAFRQEQQYIRQGYLHPENVPDGRGSEYLSKVSAILGADISIDEELYVNAITDINDLWPTPMPMDRLDATILSPMVNGKSTIDGKVIWQFDERWDEFRLVLSTKRQSSVELGFDDRRNMYYCVDAPNEIVKNFARDTDLLAYTSAIAKRQLTKPEMKQSLPLINVTADPGMDFGFHPSDDPTVRTLNTFVRTPELAIINHPEAYASLYRRPDTIIKYLETLLPDEQMRTYLLRFLRRKLTTFEYSPVVLYFMGVQGSGKDTFVSILEKIMGVDRVAKPTTKVFLETHNGWMLDTYFAQLDEYGNQLTAMKDREEALGKLKTYTGKRNIQIRQMRTDGFPYDHNITFIMTANKNPLMLEEDDRRIAFLPTPNKLNQASWIDDLRKVHDKIAAEIKDFCYWLATEIEPLNSNDYMEPPETDSKHVLIADSMYAAQRIAYVLRHGMMNYLKDLCKDYGAPKLLDAIKRKRIYTTDLEELYEIMTEFKGEMRSLNKAIRGMGIDLRPSSQGGAKTYYYDLSYFAGEHCEFTPDES